MSVTRTLVKVGAGLAAAGVGAAVGLAAERRAAGRTRAVVAAAEVSGAGGEGDGEPAFGSVRAPAMTVVSDDGTALHVEVDELPAGAPAGPTVVFTHGYTLNLDSWHYQRLALRGRYRLVFWDQRGHGRSAIGPRGHSTIEVIGEDLARVLEQAAPEGPIVLVGHSMGGMTIMAFAGAHPDVVHDRVQAVALVATSAAGLADVPWVRGQRLSRLAHKVVPGALDTLALRPELVQRGRRLGSDLEQILVRRLSFGSPVSPELVRFAAEMIAGTPIDVVADFLPAFDAHDSREALTALASTPVLILAATGDVMTPAAHSDELARWLPHAEQVTVTDSGHLVLLEHPEAVTRALLQLIDSSGGASGPRRAVGRKRTVVGLGPGRGRSRREEPA